MTRTELQELSRLRRQEARVLLDAGYYSGAYYLAGYSVECALKACIARQIVAGTFPDRRLAEKAWSHDLESLLQTAGLSLDLARDAQQHRQLDLNWTLVKDWKVDARYDTSVDAKHAEAFWLACTEANSGVLPWIEKRW